MVQATPDRQTSCLALSRTSDLPSWVWDASGATRVPSLGQPLLRIQLCQRVNVMILEKALPLELTHFEDSEFYDQLLRARREASTRPLALIIKTASVAQNAISLISYGAMIDRKSVVLGKSV